MTLQIVTITNPFDPRNRDISSVVVERKISVAEIVRSRLPAGMPVAVSLNGHTLPRDEWELTYPHANDQIVIAPVLHGGETGKSILRVVIVIVATIIGSMLGQYYLGPMLGAMMGSAAGSTAGAAIGGAIGAAVGGFIANAVLPPASAKLPTLDASYNTSSVYSWSPQNTQQQGVVISRYYGGFRLWGNIIATYLESDGEKQYLNVLLSLGLGPYKRLYDFQINDQPVENYSGVEIHTRLGNVDQEPIPNFNETKIEYPVGVKVVKDTPYTYVTIGDAFDAIEVDVTFPSGLWYANEQGGLSPVSVDISIEIRRQGDTVWTPITTQVQSLKTISIQGRWSAGYYAAPNMTVFLTPPGTRFWYEVAEGDSNSYSHYDGETYVGGPAFTKTFWRWVETPITQTVDTWQNYVTITENKTSAIRRTFRAVIPAAGRHEIRVSNLSADHTDSRYGDDCYLTAVREVLSDDFSYPRNVLVGIRALATDQLSGGFKFSCMGECALVRIWDGAAWSVDVSDNPAWVSWDMMTQPVLDNNLNVVRYDGIDPTRLDLPKWLEWAQYCADQVPAGNGGQENRLTFNGGADTEQTLWDAMMQVCQLGRAVPLPIGVNYTLAIDKPSDPVQLFTVGNIETDSFEEVFLQMEDRASELEIDFLNATNGYNRDQLTVIDADNPNKTSKTTLQLVGCTSASLAYRTGKYRLAGNATLLRTVSWGVDVDAIACAVGDVVRVQHDVPQWGAGGRLVAATVDSITLDREVTLEAGKSYVVMVRLNDDTIVDRAIATGPGSYTTLTLAAPFAIVPEKYDVYTFGETLKAVKELRLIGIRRNGTDPLKKILVGVDYNPTLDAADYDLPVLPTPDVSSIDTMPAVSGLILRERLEKASDGTIATVLDISWTNPLSPAYAGAEIWQSTGGAWLRVASVPSTADRCVLPATDLLTYAIAVRAVNTFGQKQPLSSAPTASLTVQGKSTPPADVSGIGLIAAGGELIASWERVPDVDCAGYILREGTTYDTALALFGTGAETRLGNVNSISWRPARAGNFTVWIRAIDTTGHLSEKPVSASLLVAPPPAVTNLVAEVFHNQVQLRWTAGGGTFPIVRYRLLRGDTFAAAVEIDPVTAEHSLVTESAAGAYRYWVIPVDSAGNEGPANSVTAAVDSPVDITVVKRFIGQITVGTAANIAWDDAAARWYAPVNTSETFQQHFTNNANTTFQDFITDGATLVVDPQPTTASYEEIFDLGAATTVSTVVTVDLDKTTLRAGTITCTISVSTDAQSWASLASWSAFFSAGWRYVKVRIDIAGGLQELNSLAITVARRRTTVDIQSNITDTTGNGTEIVFATFGVAFKYVDSITCQIPWLNDSSKDPVKVVINLISPVAPASFRALAYDKSNNRIALPAVSFMIRGTI